MQRARLLFLQYLVFSAVSLTGLVLGASGGAGGRLVHAVWGLVIGSATGLVVMIVMYAVAARRVGVPDGSTGEPVLVTELDPA